MLRNDDHIGRSNGVPPMADGVLNPLINHYTEDRTFVRQQQQQHSSLHILLHKHPIKRTLKCTQTHTHLTLFSFCNYPLPPKRQGTE